ncbi:MAG TPA: hypothetical protein VGI14_09010 [Casimicrobiaceae bacterium]|jgi:hypothetical protein
MSSGALSTLTFGVVRAAVVVAVLILIVGVVALVVARRVATTRRVQQGIFLGISGTGLIFVAFLAWTWLQSAR